MCKTLDGNDASLQPIVENRNWSATLRRHHLCACSLRLALHACRQNADSVLLTSFVGDHFNCTDRASWAEQKHR